MSDSVDSGIGVTSPSLPEPLKYTISAVIVLSGLIAAFLLYQLRESTGRQESDALIPLVDTARVTNYDGNLDLVVSGTVVPFREITVSAEVSGRIRNKSAECEAGTFVRQGTPLLEIDPQDYQLEIKTMQSEILQAERTLEETEEEIRGAVRSLEIAQTDHALQKNEFKRFEKLQDSVSILEFDQAKRRLLETESQLTTRENTRDMLFAKKERLKASLQFIQNRLEKAELSLARTIVTAPVDGVIVRDSVEQGDYVTIASELFVIEDTSQVEVLCTLTPGELTWLRQYTPESRMADAAGVGSSVYQLPRVAVDVFEQQHPEVIWDGMLARIDGIGRHEMTKSIPCRIVVENPVIETGSSHSVLVRGMYVKCRIIVSGSSSDRKLVAFPAIGIRPGDYVWVVRDNRLTKLNVDVVDRTPVRSVGDSNLVVTAMGENGLQIGDQVIVSPLPQPTEGGRVLLRERTGIMVNQVADEEPTVPLEVKDVREADAAGGKRTRTAPQANRNSSLDRSSP